MKNLFTITAILLGVGILFLVGGVITALLNVSIVNIILFIIGGACVLSAIILVIVGYIKASKNK